MAARTRHMVRRRVHCGVMGWPELPSAEILAQLAFWLGVSMAFASVPSVLKSRQGSPLAALSWLFTLLLFPGAGAVLWWFFGRNALRRRRSKRAAKRAEFRKRRGRPTAIEMPAPNEAQAKLAASLASEIQDCPNSRVRVLCEGPEAFSDIEQAILGATKQISVLYYVWANDDTGRRLKDVLCQRARAGVEVRVLLDSIGSMELPSHFWAPLKEAGGKVAHFMPPRVWTRRRPSINFRNHRKILVVDHDVAFSGGMNVSDHYAKAWKDVHMRCSGPAAVALEHIFCDDWYYTTGEYVTVNPSTPNPAGGDDHDLAQLTILSSGPDSPQPWIHDHYFRALASAEQRIWIATPYFVPTESICTALRTAATRGVDVRILVPGKNDQRLVQWASRAYYPSLVTAGVKIYEYQPAMMHAKVWLIDEEHSAIGSANFDPRSFRLNFEVTNLLECKNVVNTLDEWFRPMLNQSRRIQQADIDNTPTWQVLRNAAAHLWSPLL